MMNEQGPVMDQKVVALLYEKKSQAIEILKISRSINDSLKTDEVNLEEVTSCLEQKSKFIKTINELDKQLKGLNDGSSIPAVIELLNEMKRVFMNINELDQVNKSLLSGKTEEYKKELIRLQNIKTSKNAYCKKYRSIEGVFIDQST
ncbi:MAG TPA: hypothetical protein DDZ89_14530 [Clostridiales bacterium]|nr:hypothetical protein [Clostridiales bacterium]